MCTTASNAAVPEVASAEAAPVATISKKAKRPPGQTAEQELKAAKAAAKLLQKNEWELMQAQEHGQDVLATVGGSAGATSASHHSAASEIRA